MLFYVEMFPYRIQIRTGKIIAINQTTSCKNSGDTSPSWGVINCPIISHTAAPLPPPPPPLISVASKTKKCWELKQSTLKGGEGRGSGKGLNSRYGGHWKLEKVFFNESVSTILQLVVASPLIYLFRVKN